MPDEPDLLAWRRAGAIPPDAIPVIDMAPFLNGSERARAASRIRDACRNRELLYRRSADDPPKYPDVVAGEHLLSRLDATFFCEEEAGAPV